MLAYVEWTYTNTPITGVGEKTLPKAPFTETYKHI